MGPCSVLGAPSLNCMLSGLELSVLCTPWLSERPALWLEVQARVDTSSHFFWTSLLRFD